MKDSFLRWYKNAQAVLSVEPEIWLAYLHGQQLENLPHLTRAKPRFRGVCIRLMVFFYYLAKNLRVGLESSHTGARDSKFLFYGSSANQLNAMNATIDGLKSKGEAVTAIAAPEALRTEEQKERYQPCYFSVSDELKAIALLVSRGIGLYQILKRRRSESASWYFNHFCKSYVCLVYFERLLNQVRPEFVITSNDHNVENRCLLAVAQKMGVRTVYMQHASVSEVFPALSVDYAFLDGQAALDVYEKCRGNRPAHFNGPRTVDVFLAGQQKPLNFIRRNGASCVGVALNPLDDGDAVVSLVGTLRRANVEICLRWHPRQDEEIVRRLRTAFSTDKGVLLSNPNRESVSEFMEKIRFLVAGNSSIHLEAAIAGVAPIYYESTAVDQPDYYGFVRNGIAKHAMTGRDLLDMLSIEDSSWPNPASVRYYSASFHTEWEGREGDLVADCLLALRDGETDLMPINPISLNES